MKFICKISIIALCLLWSYSSYGQTRGFIFVPGSSVLDPNGDGYVSQFPSGFSNDGYYVDEFEITMFPMSKLGEGEIDSDVGRGPDCGFTDMVPDTGGYTSYSAIDTANNFIFRFRLGNSVPNSKGYSVLIDTDNLFGPADPNYSLDNPGFEIMISLEGNTDIKVYDIDGVSDCSNLKRTYSGSSNYQKAIAGTNNCGDPDYFYDFYVPFADLTTDFGISTSTPLFMASLTTMAPACGFHNSTSDIGGVNDVDFGNCFSCIFEELYCNQTSTPADSLCSTCSGINLNPTCPTDCPSFSGYPANNDSTLAGFASINAQVFIEVHYFSPPSVVFDTVVANASGEWNINLDSALSIGDSIIINAQISGRAVSEGCGYRLVENLGCEPIICSSPPFNISEHNIPFFQSGFQGNSTEPDGTIITVYNANTFAVYSTAVVTAGSWQTPSCGSANCNPINSFIFTAQASGKCESSVVYFNTCGAGNISVAAVITTDPLTNSDTIIGGTTGINDSVRLYINGYFYNETIADGVGNWSFTGVSLNYGDTISVYSKDPTKLCWSIKSNQVIVGGVPVPAVNPPLVDSPLLTGDTIVSGMAESPQGTKIIIYKNSVQVDSAFVDAFNNWTVTLSTALLAGDTIYATAVELCVAESQASALVFARGRSDAPLINCGALNLTAGDTIISGTSTEASGTDIYILIDGDTIGAALVDGFGNWTDTVALNALYAGGLLYTIAINTLAGETFSDYSDTCVVQCAPIIDTFSIDLWGALPCDTGTVTIKLSDSELGVIYEAYDIIGDSTIEHSILGTGDSLILTTLPLDTGVYQVTVYAFTISSPLCETYIKDTLDFTIYMCNEICNDAIDNDGDGLVDCADTLDCRPTPPGIITASNDTICAGVTGEFYSIAAVAGATSYIWTVPIGAGITAGQGTTNISVNWGTIGGNVCVVSNNGFCDSGPRCTSITVNGPPASPGVITH